MKTLKKFTAGALIVLILFSAASCSLFKEKESITAEDFREAMEDEGLTVEDGTDQFKDVEEVEKCLLAYTEDYQIEFYVLETEDQARSGYNRNKSDFETSFGGTGSTKSQVSIANYSKFAMTTSDGYYVLSQIDNTMIFLQVDKEYKEEVNELLETIGY